jgi:hypothetical protein
VNRTGHSTHGLADANFGMFDGAAIGNAAGANATLAALQTCGRTPTEQSSTHLYLNLPQLEGELQEWYHNGQTKSVRRCHAYRCTVAMSFVTL